VLFRSWFWFLAPEGALIGLINETQLSNQDHYEAPYNDRASVEPALYCHNFRQELRRLGLNF
jgi:hypothetical protein